MLNQNPIENLFAVIRQCGAGNINPNCFQFISGLKTTVLNNLTSNKSCTENWEKDEGRILDNLRDFLSQNLMLPSHITVTDNQNELIHFQVPIFNKNNAFTDNFDYQSLTYEYVCGFLINKLKKKFNCDDWIKNLTTKNLDQRHIFRLYKEFDKKLRLNYATEDLCFCVAAIFDAVQCYINNSGAFNKFTQKLKSILLKKINFDWITCNVHNNDLKNEILTVTIKLVIFKTLQDIQRKFDKKIGKKV
jgi:hypothetical protein